MARIGDICEILDSKRVPITATERKPGPYPYYGANGVQDYVADYIFDDDLVLLAEDGGNFGSKDKPIAYRVSGKCWVNNHAHVLKPKEGLDVDYLCYSLMFYDVTGLVNGATRQKLTQADMRKIEIPLPPLDEQRKIAAVLDKVSDLIAKRRQQLDKLDELVKARFVEMFGDVIQNTKLWPQYIFSDITTSRLGKMLDAKQQTGMCQYPYLANFNVQWFRFELDNLNKMDFNESDRIEFELRDGDLLVCEGGEIGRCAVWHNEIQPCYFQKALHRVRCKKEVVLPDYLAWWFKYNCDNKGFAAIEGAKATISHLPGAKLKALLVSVPPVEQQKQFADFVEQTEKTKATINRSLTKLEMLKKALMQKCFE